MIHQVRSEVLESKHLDKQPPPPPSKKNEFAVYISRAKRIKIFSEMLYDERTRVNIRRRASEFEIRKQVFVCFWRDSPPVGQGQGLLINEISRSHTTTDNSR
jgi:hypothetical protein